MKKVLLIGLTVLIGLGLGNVLSYEAKYNLPIAVMDLVGIFGSIIIFKDKIKDKIENFLKG